MLCVLGMSVDTSWTHRERGAAHVGCAYGGLAWARRRAGCAAARALERSGRVAVPGAARCPLFETERGVERAERRAARPEASVWRRRREVAERTREERATRETHHTYTTWWGAPRIVVCVMCVCVGCAAARVRARLSTHIGSPYVRTAGETEVSVLSRVCAVRSGGVRAMVPARSAATLSHAMERVQLYASPDAKSSSRRWGGATLRPGSTHSLSEAESGSRLFFVLCVCVKRGAEKHLRTKGASSLLALLQLALRGAARGLMRPAWPPVPPRGSIARTPLTCAPPPPSLTCSFNTCALAAAATAALA